MEPVAIIGISCLFPGANSPDEFWRCLSEGKDCKTNILQLDSMKTLEHFYDPKQGTPDRFYQPRCGIVDDSKLELDPVLSSLSSTGKVDALVQWSHFVAKEALKDSGYTKNKNVLDRCGLILGNLSLPTQDSFENFKPLYSNITEEILAQLGYPMTDRNASNLRTISGTIDPVYSAPALLAAKAMQLGGPRYCIDAACASSLYSMKLAAYYLQSGIADLMIAGAVCKPDRLTLLTGFSALQALAVQDHYSPFDQSSTGIIYGEGAGAFVLKRLSDAQRDEDHIYAVIENIGLSNDGAGKHLLSPNSKGQITALQRANPNIESQKLDYIECHATGTPLGDKTEITSLVNFYQDVNSLPSIGAVKGNIGHMLTASGMAGMLKVILGMKNNLIPPTIGVTQAVETVNGENIQKQIITLKHKWKKNNLPRRAGVNAFGFGGTNAQLILADPPRLENKTKHVDEYVPEPMSIIGMGVQFGELETLDEFKTLIYEDKSELKSPSPQRWKGYDQFISFQHAANLNPEQKGMYLDQFEFDCLELKVPPQENDLPQLQSLLMLKTVNAALKDAGFERGEESNTAVLIGMEMDAHLYRDFYRLELDAYLKEKGKEWNIDLSSESFQRLQENFKDAFISKLTIENTTSKIGNTIASRISSLWNFNGPSFTIGARENSVMHALQIAQMMLDESLVDTVVVGGVDLAGTIEHLASCRYGENHNLFNQWTVGEGAGAVVLKRKKDSLAKKQRSYAQIDVIHSLADKPNKTPAQQCEETAIHALEMCQNSAMGVELLEYNSSNLLNSDQSDFAALKKVYQQGDVTQSIALGSVQSTIGNTYIASGIAALIKSALCIHHKFLPGCSSEINIQDVEPLNDVPFYIPQNSTPWIRPSNRTRSAAIHHRGADQSCFHLLLSEPDYKVTQDRLSPSILPLMFLPVAIESENDVKTKISHLRDRLLPCDNFQDFVHSIQQEYKEKREQARYTVVLLCEDKESILHEIKQALTQVPKALEKNKDWLSPKGSCFSPNPIGNDGRIVFVYPPAGSSYPEMGRRLYHQYPSLHDIFETNQPETFHDIHHEYLFPRSMKRFNKKDWQDAQQVLQNDRLTMIASGVMYGKLTTHILKDIYHINPFAALGCSVGELSMFYAMNVWESNGVSNVDAMLQELLRSLDDDLFDFDKIKHLMPDGCDLWKSYFVQGNIEQLVKRVNQEERVFIAIKSSPKEALLSGHQEDIKRLLVEEECYGIPTANFGLVHTPYAQYSINKIRSLFKKYSSIAIQSELQPNFYSSTSKNIISLEPLTIEHTISGFLNQSIDFPVLVKQAYEDDVRIFIDMGPGNNAARWIHDCLQDRPHTIISLDSTIGKDEQHIFAALARLVANHVNINLDELYVAEKETTERKSFKKTVVNGGSSISSLLVNQEMAQLALNYFHKTIEPTCDDNDEISYSYKNSIPDIENYLQKLQQSIIQHNQRTTQLGADLQSRFLSLQSLFCEELCHSISANADWPNGTTRYSIENKHDNFSASDSVIWNEVQILEMTNGKVSSVLGESYQHLDSLSKRARMPSPPFMFVSRVTALHAEPGNIESSSIEWEYDLSPHKWYSVNAFVQPCVFLESSHCSILLFSFLRFDDILKGKSVYRVLGSKSHIVDELPKSGETFRGKIQVDKINKYQDTIIIDFHYQCFHKNKLIIQGYITGGFFHEDKLGLNQGLKPIVSIHPQNRTFYHNKPKNLSDKTSFSSAELDEFFNGNFSKCFYPKGDTSIESFQWCSPHARMLDSIINIYENGGNYGLGWIETERHINPDHWAFKAHFKDDPIFPGSLVIEGMYQTLLFYMLYIGMNRNLQCPELHYINHLQEESKFRGQIPPESATIKYQLSVKNIIYSPNPQIIADAQVLYKDVVIATRKNFGCGLRSNKFQPQEVH